MPKCAAIALYNQKMKPHAYSWNNLPNTCPLGAPAMHPLEQPFDYAHPPITARPQRGHPIQGYTKTHKTRTDQIQIKTYIYVISSHDIIIIIKPK